MQVPREYVKNGEIVLNISFDATSSLKLGNDFIEFKARFGGTAREIMRAGQPRDRDLRARERPGHGVPGAGRWPAARPPAPAPAPAPPARAAPRAARRLRLGADASRDAAASRRAPADGAADRRRRRAPRPSLKRVK